MMLALQPLLKTLVEFESVTPYDRGCQDFLINTLKSLGFTCETFDNPPVSNFFAYIGEGDPLFVFAGHTDVVPAGDKNHWHTPPFELHIKDKKAYGRGVADMKGSIAAMLIATERFLTAHQQFKGRIGFLITSGEEGDDFDKGTPHIMQALQLRGITPNFCIVGEPTSHTKLGDTVKIGRRGSLTGRFAFKGIQGHVAYPHLAKNPIHMVAPALSTLVQYQFDTGNEYFPPTSLQITHIESGGKANNVIPGTLILQLNIRYSTEQTAEKLIEHINQHFITHGLKPETNWRINGEPFLTEPGKLIEAATTAILKHTALTTEQSTSGGTSDARFIAPFGTEVIELGPINASIHQVNEAVNLDDLECLSHIYQDILKTILGNVPKVF